jgi:putative glutamine amidotransferase
MKPLIGITAGTIYKKDPESPFAYGQSHTYVEAVSTSGGIPVIIPVLKSPDEAREIFARLDGILFAGGNDLTPAMYGQQNRDAIVLDESRDKHEAILMQMALDAHMPILAICRGMQLLNVVRGGTLYQDILKEVPGAENHNGDIKEENVEILLHDLSIMPESALAQILKTTAIRSNTFHHQAVNVVGEGLIVNAKAHDGIIEGVEDMKNGYIIAVQPHPESIFSDVEPQWKLLFESFVTASAKS